jgi:hypothetical protein
MIFDGIVQGKGKKVLSHTQNTIATLLTYYVVEGKGNKVDNTTRTPSCYQYDTIVTRPRKHHYSIIIPSKLHLAQALKKDGEHGDDSEEPKPKKTKENFFKKVSNPTTPTSPSSHANPTNTTNPTNHQPSSHSNHNKIRTHYNNTHLQMLFTTASRRSRLLALPDDVLRVVVPYLPLSDLIVLVQCNCRLAKVLFNKLTRRLDGLFIVSTQSHFSLGFPSAPLLVPFVLRRNPSTCLGWSTSCAQA